MSPGYSELQFQQLPKSWEKSNDLKCSDKLISAQKQKLSQLSIKMLL